MHVPQCFTEANAVEVRGHGAGVLLQVLGQVVCLVVVDLVHDVAYEVLYTVREERMRRWALRRGEGESEGRGGGRRGRGRGKRFHLLVVARRIELEANGQTADEFGRFLRRFRGQRLLERGIVRGSSSGGFVAVVLVVVGVAVVVVGVGVVGVDRGSR
jgi:hypothetical protein